jgi:hypothetical protein
MVLGEIQPIANQAENFEEYASPTIPFLVSL